MKKFLLLLLTECLLSMLTSCHESTPPPTIQIPDMHPVGDGLSVIGFAFVGSAVVLVLGRLLR